MTESTKIELALVHYPREGELLERWQEAIQDWWCPSTRQLHLMRPLDLEIDQATAQSYLERYLERLDASLREQLAALQQQRPVDKRALQALRDFVDTQEPSTQLDYAAAVFWFERCKGTVLNDNQLHMLSRSAWFQDALAREPIMSYGKCPACAKSAKRVHQHSKADRWKQCWAWTLECEHCAYEAAGNPGWHLPSGRDDIKSAFARNPATSSDHPRACAQRQELLVNLQGLVDDWDMQLSEQLQRTLREGECQRLCREWSRHGLSATFDSLLAHTQTASHWWAAVRAGQVARSDSTSDFGAVTSLDEQLDDISEKAVVLWELTPQTSCAPAGHWAEEYGNRLSALRSALRAQDALEAATQAVLFVDECRTHGFTLPATLQVWSPSGARLPSPPVAAVQPSCPSDLPGCSVAALAQHLQQWPGVALGAVELERALRAFAHGLSPGHLPG